MSVSVVIAAFNAAATIAQTIASVTAQTHAAAEILVVDDGSRDATAEIARNSGAIVVCQPNHGVSTARNRGIALARGEWIAFLDADDRWHPEKLAAQFEALVQAPGAGFIFCDMRRERGGSVENEHWMVDRAAYRAISAQRLADVAVFDGATLAAGLLKENFIPTSAVLVRTEYARLEPFDESLRHGEDFDVWLRLLRHTGAAAVERALTTYTLHAGSVSAQWAAMLRGNIHLNGLILAQPHAYPPGLAEIAHAQRLVEERRLGIHLLRSGHRAEAVRVLRKNFRARPAAATLAWLTGAAILQTPPFSRLHGLARSLRKKN